MNPAFIHTTISLITNTITEHLLRGLLQISMIWLTRITRGYSAVDWFCWLGMLFYLVQPF